MLSFEWVEERRSRRTTVNLCSWSNEWRNELPFFMFFFFSVFLLSLGVQIKKVITLELGKKRKNEKVAAAVVCVWQLWKEHCRSIVHSLAAWRQTHTWPCLIGQHYYSQHQEEEEEEKQNFVFIHSNFGSFHRHHPSPILARSIKQAISKHLLTKNATTEWVNSCAFDWLDWTTWKGNRFGLPTGEPLELDQTVFVCVCSIMFKGRLCVLIGHL